MEGFIRYGLGRGAMDKAGIALGMAAITAILLGMVWADVRERNRKLIAHVDSIRDRADHLDRGWRKLDERCVVLAGDVDVISTAQQTCRSNIIRIDDQLHRVISKSLEADPNLIPVQSLNEIIDTVARAINGEPATAPPEPVDYNEPPWSDDGLPGEVDDWSDVMDPADIADILDGDDPFVIVDLGLAPGDDFEDV
jgi:hypothetical protein